MADCTCTIWNHGASCPVHGKAYLDKKPNPAPEIGVDVCPNGHVLHHPALNHGLPHCTRCDYVQGDEPVPSAVEPQQFACCYGNTVEGRCPTCGLPHPDAVPVVAPCPDWHRDESVGFVCPEGRCNLPSVVEPPQEKHAPNCPCKPCDVARWQRQQGKTTNTTDAQWKRYTDLVARQARDRERARIERDVLAIPNAIDQSEFEHPAHVQQGIEVMRQRVLAAIRGGDDA